MLDNTPGIMGITMLRMDRAKIKWKIKLEKAFELSPDIQDISDQKVKKSKSGKYALFLLPMVTVSPPFLRHTLLHLCPQL